MEKPKILIVDDESIILANLAQQLQDGLGNACEIEMALNAEEALEICHEFKENNQELALVVSDQLMPGKKGDEFLIDVHALYPATIKILLTGQASNEAIQRAINHANLYRYISKPWEKTDLIMTTKEAYELYKKNKKIHENNLLLESIYSNTQKLQAFVHTSDLLDYVRRTIKNEIDFDFQFFFNIDANRIEFLEGLNSSSLPMFMKWLQSNLSIIEKQKFFILNNSNLFEDFQSMVAIEVSNHFIWILGSRRNFHYFAQNWLKLFSESLKIQLQRCLLFESLEQKVEERTKEVQQQANLIQEQHQDILQSIQYANRIQKAILPKINLQNCPLKFHYIYQPKDVVSGDFYWYKNLGNHILFALGDCTGHGVPGAMLSTLSVSILNQLLTDYQKNCKQEINFQANEFLNQFAQNFSESLSQSNEYHAKDGLELGIFWLNLETLELQYAGANMDLWIVRNQQLVELEGNKQSIEGWNINKKSYNGYSLKCETNDFLVLFTDGIPDQFGGEQCKKYGYKKLREFFIEYLKPQSLPNQLDWLSNQLKEWQGGNPQTDDRACFVFKV